MIDEGKLRRFLASFDRSTTLGRRDYAMALCMSEPGLRVSEVAQMSLDDCQEHGALGGFMGIAGSRLNPLRQREPGTSAARTGGAHCSVRAKARVTMTGKAACFMEGSSKGAGEAPHHFRLGRSSPVGRTLVCRGLLAACLPRP